MLMYMTSLSVVPPLAVKRSTWSSITLFETSRAEKKQVETFQS